MVSILAYYNNAVLSFMQQMKKYHWFEFQQHIRPMLVLFIATEVSQLILLVTQVYGFWQFVCFDAKKAENLAMYDDDPESDTSFCSVMIPAKIT